MDDEKRLEETTELNNNKKGKGKLIAIISAVVLVLAGAGIFVFFRVIKPKSDYTKAKDMLQSGDYRSAKEIFLELGDYEESTSLIRECDYVEAVEKLNVGDYEGAKEVFERISDYKDAQDMAKECIYRPARELYKEGKDKEAVEMIMPIYGYSDTKFIIYEIFCKYAGQNMLDKATVATNAMSTYIQSQSKALITFAYMASYGYASSDTWSPDTNDSNLKKMLSAASDMTGIKNEYRNIFTTELIELSGDETLKDADAKFMTFYDDAQSVYSQSFVLNYFHKMTQGTQDDAPINKLATDVKDFTSVVDTLKTQSKQVKED